MISLNNVGKSFGRSEIFRDITMTIEVGKPVVIMGRNGCGKSTLLKIIANLLAHSNGEIIRTPNIKTAYAPDRFPKVPFKVSSYITHMGKILGLSAQDIHSFRDEQFKYLDIPKNIWEQKIHKCSKGTIQKVNIMQTFLTKPDLLIMDEPFSGLDEDSTERFLELLIKTAENTAVIISCHEKALAQRVTSNVFSFSQDENGISILNAGAQEVAE
ncbi:MAG: ATP-binding cassette domain-containing protein [Defluviitaleaceae bacterium]|nr:ATP-binding cassette domain-containing protein [Defluviitaleaceae bacterium]